MKNVVNHIGIANYILEALEPIQDDKKRAEALRDVLIQVAEPGNTNDLKMPDGKYITTISGEIPVQPYNPEHLGYIFLLQEINHLDSEGKVTPEMKPLMGALEQMCIMKLFPEKNNNPEVKKGESFTIISHEEYISNHHKYLGMVNKSDNLGNYFI